MKTKKENKKGANSVDALYGSGHARNVMIHRILCIILHSRSLASPFRILGLVHRHCHRRRPKAWSIDVICMLESIILEALLLTRALDSEQHQDCTCGLNWDHPRLLNLTLRNPSASYRIPPSKGWTKDPVLVQIADSDALGVVRVTFTASYPLAWYPRSWSMFTCRIAKRSICRPRLRS